MIMKEEKFLQSYLYTEYGNFFISTIHRESSAMVNNPPWYYETFAWRLNEKNERTDWIADNSGAHGQVGALKQHYAVIEQLTDTGKFLEITKE